MNLQPLYNLSQRMVNLAQRWPYRNVPTSIDWDAQLNVLIGLRGVGKTTTLLHQLSRRLKEGKKALYISLDGFYFLDQDLWDTIEAFALDGGEYLFIDEAHYHKYWDRAVKIAYDTFPRLRITVTGSSAMKLYDSKADLSRRGHFYTFPGLSFREYLALKEGIELPSTPYDLDTLILDTHQIAIEITKLPGILSYFRKYIRAGYFPFAIQNNVHVSQQLQQLVEGIVDIDMAILGAFDLRERRQILKFLKYLVAKPPYELNISKVSSLIGLDRNKLIHLLYTLERADILRLINIDDSKKGSMSKPDKIYLNNPNLYFALSPNDSNIGSVRECFVLNQLEMSGHAVSLHKDTDFLVDEHYSFEVGGRNKKGRQVQSLENAYILADDIELPYANYIPLWMIGLLY